jgi:flavin-dependent dehydrogenase
MRTFHPGGGMKEIKAPGFTIARDLFDQTLAEAARKAGAILRFSTKAISRGRDGVILRDLKGRLTTINTEVIIGADGPFSIVGKWIGSQNRQMIPSAQVRVALLKPSEFTEVYFDREIYGGYGWLFPKGREANVGLGMKKRVGGSLSMSERLRRFVSHLCNEGKIAAEPIRRFGGWIPAETLRSFTRDNILLVGDAAGQTHPITGAGILPAVVGGRMAGKWAVRAVEKSDSNLLKNYEGEWRDLFGESHERAFERRCLMEREWDRLEEILPRCWVAYREYYA